MQAPRLTSWFAISLLVVVLGLACPAARAAGPVQTRPAAPAMEEDEDAPQVPAWLAGGLLRLNLMLTTMARAPSLQPKGTQPAVRITPQSMPVPIVVRAPSAPTDRLGPPIDGTPNPAAVPEPASLATGLVGAGVAAAAWLRRRRRRVACSE